MGAGAQRDAELKLAAQTIASARGEHPKACQTAMHPLELGNPHKKILEKIKKPVTQPSLRFFESPC
jgi:hypothetical protein